MHDFSLVNDRLHIEGIALNELARQYGTPCYVYSKAAITRAYLAYQSALGSHPGKICYAVKANSNLAILQVLAELGAGFDIVSIGELKRVLRAGGKAEKIIFSGVGKTRAEMHFALEQGIACFNVESEAELELLAKVAAESGRVAPISFRVNPDVDANTHPYISTGLKENKFGIPIKDAVDLYKKARDHSSIRITGVDCHIGSQLTAIAPFLDALDRMLGLIDTLKTEGIEIKHLDLGGGLGVTYRQETPPDVAFYIGEIKQRLGARALDLLFEPGRSIVANAGVLLTEVLYLKPGEHKNFAIVDAAMNDIIRPSLYKAWQELRPTQPRNDTPAKVWDVVGPICESGDFIAHERELALQAGDILALMSSGAYGFTMASNYNTRCRAAEVLVDGSSSHVIRERECFDDLIKGEKLIHTAGS